jgi:hypothetical protein
MENAYSSSNIRVFPKVKKTEHQNPEFGPKPSEIKTQGVCHTVALPFTLKEYLKAKKELWELKYFIMQKYKLQKIL